MYTFLARKAYESRQTEQRYELNTESSEDRTLKSFRDKLRN